MDNAKNFLWGILSLIIGFYVGRTLLPAGAASRYVVPLGGQAQPAAQAPQAALTPAPPIVTYTPFESNAYPTPYPTPPVQGDVVNLPPSNPNLYPTPYAPPANSANPVSPPPAAATSRLPSAAELGNVDWGTHLPYVILALLALAVAAKKYTDARILCVALFMLGIIAGRYLDFGPISWPKAIGVVVSAQRRENLS